MIFGLTVEKLLVIGIIATLLIGPERLPRYAEALARFTARAREFLRGAKTRVEDEMGDEVDWQKLDPRQYDPRRIIRQALLDDAPVPAVHAPAPQAAGPAPTTWSGVTSDGPTPFDPEAT